MHSVSDFISVKKVMWARIALDINTVQTVLASIIRYPFVSQIQSKFLSRWFTQFVLYQTEVLLLGPRSDGNRRRNFPCSAFSSTCYA